MSRSLTLKFRDFAQWTIKCNSVYNTPIGRHFPQRRYLYMGESFQSEGTRRAGVIP